MGLWKGMLKKFTDQLKDSYSLRNKSVIVATVITVVVEEIPMLYFVVFEILFGFAS
jgi:hypothetical protein